jgi:hypothetical protein
MIQLLHCVAHFCSWRSEEVCEQQGDILQWDQLKKDYMLTHGVSGGDWRFYELPLPNSVYDVYLKYWAGVSLRLEFHHQILSLYWLAAPGTKQGKSRIIEFRIS